MLILYILGSIIQFRLSLGSATGNRSLTVAPADLDLTGFDVRDWPLFFLHQRGAKQSDPWNRIFISSFRCPMCL